MNSFFNKKRILVTGGVGSIGSEIVMQLIDHKPEVIRIFDNNENLLYRAQCKYASNKNIRPLIGDIRDVNRLKKAMHDVDYVFHAAALKHVELSDYNPFEAVQTNIIGTQNVIDAALSNNVERVVVISTDKAVNPQSTMGATKLVSEKITVAAHYHKGNRRTRFAVVRFGNVIDSNGSVIPTWLDQLKHGGPITITDKKMTRFMMNIKDAVKLVFDAAQFCHGGEIFILDMTSLKIIDLAKVMIKHNSIKYGYKPQDISIVFEGKRSGEKLHEELITENELPNLYRTNNMLVILPRKTIIGLDMKTPITHLKKCRLGTIFSSNNQQLLTQGQIYKLLKKAKVLD